MFYETAPFVFPCKWIPDQAPSPFKPHFVKQLPSYFHVNEFLIKERSPFKPRFVKQLPSYFHVNEFLIKERSPLKPCFVKHLPLNLWPRTAPLSPETDDGFKPDSTLLASQ